MRDSTCWVEPEATIVCRKQVGFEAARGSEIPKANSYPLSASRVIWSRFESPFVVATVQNPLDPGRSPAGADV